MILLCHVSAVGRTGSSVRRRIIAMLVVGLFGEPEKHQQPAAT